MKRDILPHHLINQSGHILQSVHVLVEWVRVRVRVRGRGRGGSNKERYAGDLSDLGGGGGEGWVC